MLRFLNAEYSFDFYLKVSLFISFSWWGFS